MSKVSRHSSFTELPNQIEWAFPALIGYSTYVFIVSTGCVSLLAVLTGLIMLNGWISSRATSNLYSDWLLAIDVSGISLYFCMVSTLNLSRDHVNPAYWFYCAGLCLSYLFWDVAILPLVLPLVGVEIWKKRFKLYVILMGIAAGLFVLAYLLHALNIFSETVCAAYGSFLWLALLGKWHLDQRRSRREG